MPAGMEEFRFPAALIRRLHELLNRQDGGSQLTAAEREQADELVNLADWLSLLKLRSTIVSQDAVSTA
jgi:hypothetical protein